MEFPFYPRPEAAAADPVELPTSRFLRHGKPEGYQPDDGLASAVNVALMLGQPLLVTGEPGTGKTDLAYHLAANLGLGKPLVFEAKSGSTARDLFYTFDTVGRFRAGAEVDPRLYISYEALGRAILLTNAREAVERWLPPGFVHDRPRRCVVLVDEVDKAPRDFPNDILNEVERMRFRVPELGSDFVAADDDLRPILVITSNSEKNLPDAFLRRCIYYDIPFPEPTRLREIVLARMGHTAAAGEPFLTEALELFWKLRREAGLRKSPATAELLGWLDYLGRRLPGDRESLRQHTDMLYDSLGSLLKTAQDQAAGRTVVRNWLQEHTDGR